MADQQNWVYSLADESLLSVAGLRDAIGGKAASLVRLQAAGKRIPPGFVVVPAACREFWSLQQSWPAGLAKQIDQALAQLELLTGRRYGRNEMPLTLAVRSGAAVSMPGTMATVLNVGEKETVSRHNLCQEMESTSLGTAIRTVFDSWNSPAAQSYRRAHQIDDDLSTAVIIQVMQTPRVSGVMFTRDPRRVNSNEMVVEAVQGSGEELVLGTKSGSCWLLPRDGQVGPATVEDDILDSEQLALLRTESLQLEDTFGEALDLEWGLDDAGWVFFQARPIKFLQPVKTGFWEQEQARLEQFRASGETLFVRHNLSESLRCPTPLSWSIWKQFATPDGGLGKLYKRMGFAPCGRPGQSVLELFGGEIYACPQRLVDLYCSDFPFRFNETELCENPALIDRLPTQLDLERAGPWFLLRLPEIIFVTLRSMRRLNKLAQNAAESFHEEFLPRYEEYLRKEGQRDLQAATLDECRSAVVERTAKIMGEFYPELLLPGTVGATCYGNADQQLTEILGESDGTLLARQLWDSIPQPIVERQQTAFANLAESDEYLPNFVEEFGHRGFHEMELASPRWRDDCQKVKQQARDLSRLHRRTNGSERTPKRLEDVEAMIRARFSEIGAASLASDVLSNYRSARSLMRYREEGKHHFLRGYELIRTAVEALALKTGLGADIYYLTLSELRDADGSQAVADRIGERKSARLESQSKSLPAVLDAADSLRQSQSSKSPVLKGTTICPGRGTGRVVFPDHVDLDDLDEAYVLVCQFLTPDILPIFAGAAAVIVDQASILSHGAVLAREFGVPVVSSPGATKALTVDSFVVVDADNGTVTCMEPSP